MVSVAQKMENGAAKYADSKCAPEPEEEIEQNLANFYQRNSQVIDNLL